MQPAMPEWDFQFQARMGSRVVVGVKGFFRAVKPLLEPGLTDDLHRALMALKREIELEVQAGESSAGGYLPIPWARWREMLGGASTNTIKARLARLEELGRIEILQSERGSSGTSLNCYRLAGPGGGHMRASITPLVLKTQEWEARENRHVPGGAYGRIDTPPSDGTTAVDTPLSSGAAEFDTLLSSRIPATDTHLSDRITAVDTPLSARTVEIDTALSGETVSIDTLLSGRISAVDTPLSGGIAAVDTPLPRYKVQSTKVLNQSVHQSVPKSNRLNELIDGLTDGSYAFSFDWRPWLKEADPGPWPEPLVEGIKEILGPGQIRNIERRSPWSAEGAWAILQALRAMGPGLGNKPGTLWNALVQVGKGVERLEIAGPLLREVGWRMEPEDGTPVASLIRSMGCRRLAREGLARLPLHGEALERHRRLLAPVRNREDEVELDFGDDDWEEEPMEKTEVNSLRGPEALSHEVRAELRVKVEEFRAASMAAMRSPAVNRPGFFDACTRSWGEIRALLEPALPLQVEVPEEARILAIREPSQIKMNVVNALYRAVS